MILVELETTNLSIIPVVFVSTQLNQYTVGFFSSSWVGIDRLGIFSFVEYHAGYKQMVPYKNI